jgi:hypothetical protein
VEGGKEFNEDRHDGGENGAGPSASARPSVRYCDEIVDDDGDNSACLPRYSEFQLSELGNPQLSVGLKFT